MKIGDLVRYKFDPLSKKVYLVATIDSDKYQPHDRFVTLHGWNTLNAGGLVQRFRLDALEIINENW
jgi:hypothetical protein|tara:strand:+ start:77 stop:274 length:198 start_codon:yes stop_codon:yes gene_type:complete